MSDLTFEKVVVEKSAKTSALSGLLSRQTSHATTAAQKGDKRTEQEVDEERNAFQDSVSKIGTGGTSLTLESRLDSEIESLPKSEGFTAKVFFPSRQFVTVTVIGNCSIRQFVEVVVSECVSDRACLEHLVVTLSVASLEGHPDEDYPVLDERRLVSQFGVTHFSLDAKLNSSSQDKSAITAFHAIKPTETTVHIGPKPQNKALSPRSRLFRAAEKGDLDEVREVVDNSVSDVSFKGMDNWTGLHFAARQGHLPVVNFLLKRSSDLDATTKSGWTPLLLACYQGHYEVVEILLTCGADQSLVDALGHSALYYAEQQNKADIVQLLHEFLEEAKAEQQQQQQQ